MGFGLSSDIHHRYPWPIQGLCLQRNDRDVVGRLLVPLLLIVFMLSMPNHMLNMYIHSCPIRQNDSLVTSRVYEAAD